MNRRAKNMIKDTISVIFTIVLAGIFLFAIVYPMYLYANGNISEREFYRMR